MNKWVLQLFLFLAFLPLAILVGYGIIVFAPIYCCIKAINSYRFENLKEMYFWIALGFVSFLLALKMLGTI
ncbi:hypothetical protein N9J91_03225 [Gammaproteobacteria bacterium]|jgi:hypothetical protein|nr:hypothetical protein [Gammaproteobacteria bacterium]MDB4059574.1 hypothetical protein [Gammaproteobacteria bacterium]|tara:strand:+ start:509 stop:721 length:213 start_codon:yes stop_codon:yes gene_type:complete